MDFKLVVAAGLIGGVAGGIGGLLLKLTKAGPGDAKRQVQLAIIPAIVVGALATPLHWDEALASVIFPKSPREAVYEKYGKMLTDDPAFPGYMKGQSDVHTATQQLSAKGLHRLTPAQAREAASVRLMLAQRSPQVCAGMWTGKQDPKALPQVIDSLSVPELDRFMSFSTTAALRELHGEGDVISAPADPMATLAAVTTALGDRGADLTRALQAGEQASDAEGCKATQLLLEAIGKLPDDQVRQAFALATQ
jgi:hypothetical protein